LKRRFTYGLQGAISQKMATFCIAVITSNPTLCPSATLQYGQTRVNADQFAYVNCNSQAVRSPSNQCSLSFEMNGGGAPPWTIPYIHNFSRPKTLTKFYITQIKKRCRQFQSININSFATSVWSASSYIYMPINDRNRHTPRTVNNCACDTLS
jgi:hypothetical protein